MARQVGPPFFIGRVGNQIGYCVRGQHYWRRATETTFKKLAITTKKNCYEFGDACKDGTLIRESLHPLVLRSRGTLHVSQLSTRLLRLIKSDKENVWGQRNLNKSNLESLENFEFNSDVPFRKNCKIDYDITYLKKSGIMTCIIKSFKPEGKIKFPKGATHFVINSSASAIDFTTRKYARSYESSQPIEFNSNVVQEFTQNHTLKIVSKSVIFMGISVEFYNNKSGKMLLILKNLNPCKIAKVIMP